MCNSLDLCTWKQEDPVGLLSSPPSSPACPVPTDDTAFSVHRHTPSSSTASSFQVVTQTLNVVPERYRSNSGTSTSLQERKLLLKRIAKLREQPEQQRQLIAHLRERLCASQRHANVLRAKLEAVAADEACPAAMVNSIRRTLSCGSSGGVGGGGSGGSGGVLRTQSNNNNNDDDDDDDDPDDDSSWSEPDVGAARKRMGLRPAIAAVAAAAAAALPKDSSDTDREKRESIGMVSKLNDVRCSHLALLYTSLGFHVFYPCTTMILYTYDFVCISCFVHYREVILLP